MRNYKIDFDSLSHLADKVRGEALTDYSGRGMYGAECVAITMDSDASLLALGAEIAKTIENPHLAVMLLHESRMDSMGLGSVIYWPAISCADAPASED